MIKLNDLKGVMNYYCSECKHYHIRKYKYKIDKEGLSIKTKDTPFFNHIDYAWELTTSEKWHTQMSNSLKSYSIKKHKATVGSRKQ